MCDCADHIERAASKGHHGLAEYIAERCDRRHQVTAAPTREASKVETVTPAGDETKEAS